MGSESFVSTYNTNRKDATLMALDDSAVGSVLLQIAPTMKTWAGSSANLLAALTKIRGQKARRLRPLAEDRDTVLQRVAPRRATALHAWFIHSIHQELRETSHCHHEGRDSDYSSVRCNTNACRELELASKFRLFQRQV